MAVSGSIADVGDSVTCTYAGAVESFTVPLDGLYKLEVYGAKGGTATAEDGGYYAYGSGGNGGYSIGYLALTAGETLYICVGGTNGYNGGGSKNGSYQHASAANGGGCTHIAKTTNRGLLSAYASHKDEVLIVAGGGGGGGASISNVYDDNDNYSHSNRDQRPGGTGGGITGGSGDGSGGSQSAGGSGSNGSGSFGRGGTSTLDMRPAAGGGGGWYGGGSGNSYAMVCSSAGGGSGYIGGVPSITYKGKTYEPATSNDRCTGNGSAVITFVEKATIHLLYNGSEVSSMIYNGAEVKKLIYNGVELF